MTTKNTLYTITHFMHGRREGDALSGPQTIMAEDVEQYSHDQSHLLTKCTSLAADYLKTVTDKKFALHIRPAFGDGYPGVEIHEEGAAAYAHAWVVVEAQLPDLSLKQETIDYMAERLIGK
jgi:hypothetical protein